MTSDKNATAAAQFEEPAAARGGKAIWVSITTSIGALLAACSCCILPIALATLGASAGLSGVLSPLGPLRWPMTAASVLALTASWIFYFRQRRLRCMSRRTQLFWAPSGRLLTLIMATKFALVASFWSYLEPELMNALG